MTKTNAEKIKNILENLHNGLDPEEAKKIFKEELGQVNAKDLAQAENELLADGLPIEELQGLCNVHASIMDKNVEEIHWEAENSHPLNLFHLENLAIENHLSQKLHPSAQSYFKNPDQNSKEDFLGNLSKLKSLSIHYDRKENLIFPILENKGITSIPQVMWGVDDEIRNQLKEVLAIVTNSDYSLESIQKIQNKLPDLVSEIRSMITKEEDILTPLLKETLDESNWVQIAKETDIYPIQFLESNPYASREAQEKWIQTQGNIEGLGIQEETFSPSIPSQASELSFTLNFPTGNLNFQELESIFSAFPMELTFTDKDNKVRYFSDHKNMIFPRPMSSLGRDVLLCHPPKSKPIVEQLLKDFKSGEKDMEVRWLKKGDLLLMIRYMAVRDKQGNYQGCLELVENLKNIPGSEEYMK